MTTITVSYWEPPYPPGTPICALKVALWLRCGCPMVALWFPYGCPMVPLWFPYGSPMVDLWFPYGSPMVALTRANITPPGVTKPCKLQVEIALGALPCRRNALWSHETL